MVLTRPQVAALAALLLTGVAGFAGLTWHAAAVRAELSRLRGANQALAALREANVQLKRALAEADELRTDDAAFAEVRYEAVALQARLTAVALLPQRVVQPARATLRGNPEMWARDRPPRPTLAPLPDWF